jgi:ABC-type dipeptide/oligopeptide/nickel transport system ATPase subunit
LIEAANLLVNNYAMKKIDLHLHTKTTISDSPFVFDLEKLKEYVRQMEIDCIAVTNHNLFDLPQYQQIAAALNIPVLPGIEIDLEGGHLLLLADPANAAAFEPKCEMVFNHYQTGRVALSVEQLNHIYGDLSAYLLIPHYDKKPIVSEATLRKLAPHIQVGEVASIKKFIACAKDIEGLVPVLFSDLRFSVEMNSFPSRQTWVDLDEISFRGIKACLSDRTKVSLSKADGNEVFQVTPDGLKLSKGLSVILGERSSGKTHTLDRICLTLGNIKYIKQFALQQREPEKFEELTNIRNSNISDVFLKEFKEVLDDVNLIGLEQNGLELDIFISTLLKHASEDNLNDLYSKTALFSETPFSEINVNGTTQLIDALRIIIDNTEHRPLIEKHVSLDALKSLATELILKLRNETRQNRKFAWLNTIIRDIQSDLQLKSTATLPKDADLYRILLEKKKVEKFCQIAQAIKREREINRKDIKHFKIVTRTAPFQNATEMKAKYKTKSPFVTPFGQYNRPYEFLKGLKDIESIPATEYYRFFVDVTNKTLNRHGYQVSGGERSEFNLLHEINDALQYDALLIDEPESSFDNIFLKSEVNEMLKHIAQSIPVIIVTHNSTVGASIRPDWLVYTKRDVSAHGVAYHVYFGRPSDKQLTSSSGERIDNYKLMMDCLEAGEAAYQERRTNSYEILKN